jgi:hypothetical protein
MFKKLVILNIVFILFFSSAVYASSFGPDRITSVPTAGNILTLPEPKDTESDFTSKDYITDEDQNNLKLVTFLRPDDFSKTFETNKDVFFFSCKALAENLIIKLFVFDVEEGKYVPVQKEVFENGTNDRKIINTSWKFGLSGYLFCSFKMPTEGMFEYRLLIYDADLTEEQFLLGENLQILDFIVSYKEAKSFEIVLEDSFWKTFFDSNKYDLPLLS